MTVKTYPEHTATIQRATNIVDATSEAQTVSVPIGGQLPAGSAITFVKGDATSNAVTIVDGDGNELGVLDSQGDMVTCVYDETTVSAGEAEALIGTKVNLGVFGDGSDGDRTITDAQTLSSNVFYRNLTITDTGSLNTNGWALFVSNLLTLNGVLHFNGEDGIDGGDGGAAVARNYLGGSNAGGNGAAVNGTAGAAVTNAASNAGGQGGDGDPGLGASAGANTIFPDANGGVGVIHMAHALMTGFSQGELIEAGSGGGGGGGDAVKKGGGGGASGGYLMVAARAIAGAGTISALGGDGGDGEAGGNTGGGGGGAGGIVGIVTESPLPATITVDVSAGVGGAKVGTGVDGSNGEDGVAVTLYGVK